MYKSIIRPILFKFDPEKVHHFTFSTLKNTLKIPGVTTDFPKTYLVE
jgi:dihydroorotate dehydrogenase